MTGDRHLCVDFLWDRVLLDPGMNLSELLSLFLAEPGLKGLKHPKLLPVFSQHLILVPGGEERRDKGQRRHENGVFYLESIYKKVGLSYKEGLENTIKSAEGTCEGATPV